MMDGLIKCTLCGQEKQSREFYKSSILASGKDGKCKACVLEKQRKVRSGCANNEFYCGGCGKYKPSSQNAGAFHGRNPRCTQCSEKAKFKSTPAGEKQTQKNNKASTRLLMGSVDLWMKKTGIPK